MRDGWNGTGRSNINSEGFYTVLFLEHIGKTNLCVATVRLFILGALWDGWAIMIAWLVGWLGRSRLLGIFTDGVFCLDIVLYGDFYTIYYEVWGRMESDVDGFCSDRCKRCAVSRKLLISCHTSGLEGGAGIVDSMTVSRLSRSPSSAAAPSA